MGVGKTSVCRCLQKRLDRSVFLDGDWCWDMNPFQVTEETRAMVLDNICHLLGNFLSCSAYDHVILGWVMDRQSILDAILSRLDTSTCQISAISLVCSPQILAQRLQRDVDAGIRKADIIPRSLARLPLYEALDTVKLDTSGLSPEAAAQWIQRSG